MLVYRGLQLNADSPHTYHDQPQYTAHVGVEEVGGGGGQGQTPSAIFLMVDEHKTFGGSRGTRAVGHPYKHQPHPSDFSFCGFCKRKNRARDRSLLFKVQPFAGRAKKEFSAVRSERCYCGK